MLFDSHCHIQFQSFNEDRGAVLDRCIEKNIIINAVGTQKDTSKKAVELAEQYENIYATVGLHPIQEYRTKVVEENTSFISRGEDFDEKFYEELINSDQVIAIGEIGLDAHHVPKDVHFDEVMKRQKEIFVQQFKFANKHNLPMVIHVRNCHEEMLDLLNSVINDWNNNISPGLIHGYSGTWQQAQEYLEMGFYIGFTGTVTFPPKKTEPELHKNLLEVVMNVPYNRILVETDAPYLAPQKYRGKRCEPWMVEEVVEKIAEIRQKSYEETKEQTLLNAQKLFTRINLKK